MKFIEDTFRLLAEKTRAAALKLAEDNYVFTLNVENPSGLNPAEEEVLLPSTLKACETVCNAIGEVELTLSRATSLLQKFPDQYDLVHHLLCREDGEGVHLTSNSERGKNDVFQSIQRGMLGLLHETSEARTPASSCEPTEEPSEMSLPCPFAREFILRNLDESQPCQLLAQVRALSVIEEKYACILAIVCRRTSPKSPLIRLLTYHE